MATDLYKALNLKRNASAKTIKKAYRMLAMEFHPDRNPGSPEASERFKEVQQAYEVLGDAEKRKHYDETGEVRGSAPDNAHGEVVTLIGAIFGAVVSQIVEKGIDIKQEDVALDIRESLKNRRIELEGDVRKMETARATLKEAVGRFSADGAENYFESITAYHLAEVEKRLSGVKHDWDVCNRAIEMMKKFKFRTDKAKGFKVQFGGWTATTWSSATGS